MTDARSIMEGKDTTENADIKLDKENSSDSLHECQDSDMEQEEQANPEPEQIDGGYGWVCVACILCISAFTWGQISAYGIYLSYYLSSEVFPSATSLDFALIGGISFGTSLLVAPLATEMVKLCHGIHIPMFMGTILMSGAFISASFANKIWQLYLSQGLLVGIGLGFLWLPCIAIIPQWFHARRSLANGIASAGTSIGGVLFSTATGPMIDHLGYRWALRITGILCLVMNGLATAFIRDRNKILKPSQKGFDVSLLREKKVWMLLAWAFFIMLGFVTLLYSLSAFATSIGLTQQQARNLTAILNAANVVGRPLIGFASDRLGRIQVAGSLTFITGVFIFAIWIPANSYGVSILFAAVGGLTLGVFWPTVGPMAQEVAHLKQVPSVLSLTWLSMVLPSMFSEVIALKIRQPTTENHQYLYTQIFTGLAYIIASIFLALLWRQKRREMA